MERGDAADDCVQRLLFQHAPHGAAIRRQRLPVTTASPPTAAHVTNVIPMHQERHMETLILKMGGMSCGGCVRHVSGALEAVPGTRVDEVKVGAATVAIDPQKTTRSALAQAVRAAGYEVI